MAVADDTNIKVAIAAAFFRIGQHEKKNGTEGSSQWTACGLNALLVMGRGSVNTAVHSG